MPTISKITDIDLKSEVSTGFLGGLNTFQDENVIKESELTDAKNILLTVDGIEPRDGILHYGSSNGDKVLGGFGFYKSDGTRKFIRFASGANSKLQYYNGTTPTDIGSTTYDDDAEVNFVQARDKVFIFNGVDNLSYYDGSSITTYTALTTPGSVSVAPQGTTGSTTYSYRISAFNNSGETLASISTTTTTGNASLNSTNFNRVTWGAVSGATGYNIWGREATGLAETFMASVYGTTTYDDKGQDDPSLVILPPESNNTKGIIAKFGIFALQRIFASGDPSKPSRLYFSGVGDRITDFSGSDIGGGWIDVFRNDGAEIRSILPFQGGVLVWKDNAIFKFSFAADGSQQLEEITRSFGGISFRGTKHVENDIVFPAKKDGRLAFYSLGNQENYAGSVLRTNELSIKVSSMLRDVNVSRLNKSAAFYFNNIYGCAISKSGSTVNDRVWCLDTRFGAWVYHEGYTPNFFTDYTDSDGNQNLYFGDDSSGYVEQMFYSDKSDNGSAIDVRWATKAFNQKRFATVKQYQHPTFQFKNVTKSGALSGYIYLDGGILSAGFTVNTQSVGGAGVGYGLFGLMLPGEAPGGLVSSPSSSDVLVRVRMIRRSRSIKYVFTSNTLNASYKFLSLEHGFAYLERPIESAFIAYPSS